ncbi:protein singed wings 2-like [Daphnia carinata]|uniref:protein singed wings 2-like n=1 Tax=Daphnia carinata TaxID=120202 RepID=UPI00257B8533|nr:protein singed wings 2-like [Daphnia carinata]
MARTDGEFFTIVWLVLVLVSGTCQGEWRMYPDLSTTTSVSHSAFINANGINNPSGSDSWNKAVRPSKLDQQRACPCCRDECDFQTGNLTCHQVFNFTSDYLDECSAYIVSLNIVEGQFKTVNQSGLLHGKYPKLRRLSIRNSHLEQAELWPVPQQLIELDLSNNSRLQFINWIVFKQAINLEMLILANNKLDRIPDMISMMNETSRLSTLELSGNEWNCQGNFQWVLTLHERGILLNGDNLKCRDAKHNESWIDLSYSIIKRENNKKTVDAECRSRTSGCYCEFDSAGIAGRGSYTVQVDCSNRQMTSLPAELPNFTNELDVSGNDLTSLDQVMKYRNSPLKVLIADSNRIESIRNLSGSDFIRNFSRFSLRHNSIKPSELPLDDIVQVEFEFQVKYIYLYNNSWECDCNTATKVRDWLWKYHHVVNDSSHILCSRDGKKIPVLHLLPNQVCDDPNYLRNATSDAELKEQNISILHSIIYVEVAAIAVLGLKLAYDSWHYFRHGQLPWIATKLL